MNINPLGGSNQGEGRDGQRLDTLVNRMLEGLAGDGEIAELERLLAASSEAVDRYLDLSTIHSMLEWRLGRAAEMPGASSAISAAPVMSLPLSPSLEGSDHVPTAGSPRSPVLGFLGGFSDSWTGFGSLSPTFWALLVLVAGTVFTGAAVLVVAVCGIHVRIDRPDIAQADPAQQQKIEAVPAKSTLVKSTIATNSTPNATPEYVGRMTRMVDCRWIVEGAAPAQGERLHAGESLHLAAGVVSLEFDIGAKLILQGPAELAIVSAKELRLDRGKLAAEITTDKAHGFTVYTPQGKLVDLGTEFGIEIAPDESSKVHVFRGKVEVALPTADGQLLKATQCLLADGDARVAAGTDTMAFFADTGESFVRSLDRLKRDQHIVAYWRFEDKPLGTLAPHTNKNKASVRATVDSSFNGNDLYAWNDETRPLFSGEVAEKQVPQTQSANRACLDTSRGVPKTFKWGERNVYTHSAFSHAAPLDIQKIHPAQWTIEASVRQIIIGPGDQTIVGRDTYFMGDKKPGDVPPRLSLEVTKNRNFAIRFVDADNRTHVAVAEQMLVLTHHWYHLAAVSDGRKLMLYVDQRNGQGYQCLASTDLPATGSTALGKGADTAEWSVARGVEENYSGKFFRGQIDEVRVSDVARKPAEFLFSKGPDGERENVKADGAESRTEDDLE